MDVDTALSEVPVNILPLLDDTDYKTRETAITYDQAGMDLVWNFVTTGGAFTQTAVTPTTGGDYDWASQGDGMYTIEMPGSGGASINNDAEGFGWFTGYATGVLPWRGPIIGFRAAGLNNALIDSAYSTTRGLAGTALPDAAADAAGGLPISDAGGLDLDTQIGTDVDAILVDTAELQTDWTNGGRLDLLIDAIKAVTDNLPNSGALTDLATAAALAVVDGIVDAIKAVTDNLPNSGALTDLASAADLATVAGYIDTEVAAIKTTTDKLDDTLEDDGGTYRFTQNALEQAPSAGDATAANQTTIITHLTDLKGTGFVKDTDSMVDLGHTGADGDTLEDLSDQLDNISTTAGAGAVTWTVTIEDGNSDPVNDADVWVTSDQAGTNVLASGETDSSGQVTFYLDTGTVYMWVQKPGYDFTNPTTVTVTA